MQWLTFMAKRFVAGETAEDAVEVARRMNARKVSVILDFLGEHVATAPEAQTAVEEYLRLLGLIQQAGVKAAVSLKASQMGLLVSLPLCLENLLKVARRAQECGVMVWMDMEGSALTQKTIDVFERLRSQTPNVGLCLQAYLVRTGGDLDRLMRAPLNVRLCKGAYDEPAAIAYRSKKAVDGSYRMLAQKLLESIPRGVYPAFATHDRALINDLLARIREHSVHPDTFEFEMLYGIQTRYLETLAQQGFRAQVYVPYGQKWLPYFMRRLRERKENIYFLIRNIFRM